MSLAAYESLLFLTRGSPGRTCIADEITSGLDSHSAEVVMASLKRVASAHPLAILVSIHQPTSATLYHFDQIGVLGRGGVALYGGPPQAMHLFLESCVPELFTNSSSKTPPIELLIRQSCCATPTDALTLKLVRLAEEANFSKSFEIELLEETYLLTSADELKRAFQINRFTLHSVRQLLGRQLLYLRNYLWKEWLAYIAFGTLFAACLRLLVPESVALPSSCVNPAEDDLTARLSGSGSCEDVVVAAAKSSPEKLNAELLFLDNYYYLYYAVIIYMLLPLFYSTISWHLDAGGCWRVKHRNVCCYYSTGAFFLAKSVIEVPPVLITNALFVAIVNIYDSVLGWKESSGSSGLFWPLWRLLTLSQMGSLGMGACFAMAGGKNGHRSLTAPVIVLCGTCLTLMVVSNNLVPIGEMHYVYQLLSWFSIPRFTYETVSLLVFGFGRCKRGEEVSAMLYTLSLSDEDEGDYYRNVGILLCNVLFYRSLALYLLITQ
ncbi:ABC protein, sub ABCG [Tyrophagus putrescentiae]|nr:ABC protein, sub ABCG [Tyrophagus putrescentiae]